MQQVLMMMQQGVLMMMLGGADGQNKLAKAYEIVKVKTIRCCFAAFPKQSLTYCAAFCRLDNTGAAEPAEARNP